MPAILKKIIQVLLERPDIIIIVYNLITELVSSPDDDDKDKNKEKG